MKILVTGSNGLLGQKLVRLLKAKSDVTLIAASRGQNRIADKAGYAFEELDITDPSAVERIMSRHKPHAVIHTAAMTQVDLCESRQAECWKTNVESVRSFVRECQKHGTRLIQISSDFIFDGTSGPYREGDPPNPLNFYGRSKLAAEELLLASSIPWTLLRTILVYGLAENRPRPNVVLWVKESLEKGRKIRVVKDQLRMPTLAEDLAWVSSAAATKGAGGIYHVSGGEMMSIFELARQTADFFGLDPALIEPVGSEELAEPARRPLKTGFILKKACRDLDYRPRSFREGLAVIKDQLGSS